MSRFIVYANADPASRKFIPYWLNVQSELIDTASSRVVVPLIKPAADAVAIKHLMPEFDIAGRRMLMDTAQITNVTLRMLGKPVADLSQERRAILSAIDMLISGI